MINRRNIHDNPSLKYCFNFFWCMFFVLSASLNQIAGEAIYHKWPLIANHRVLKLFSFENSPIEVFRSPIFTFQDRDGQYWISEYGGARVLRYDGNTQTWTIFWDKSENKKGGL